MSRLRRSAQNPHAGTATPGLGDLIPEAFAANEQVEAEPTHVLTTMIRRHRVQFHGTGRQLSEGRGVRVSIPDAERIFGVGQGGKAVVSKIEALATYTDADFPVNVSANLIDGEHGMDIEQFSVDNDVGFLYKTSNTSMGQHTNFHNDGYINLLSMNPYSRNETPHEVYRPTNAVDSGMLEKYGMYDVNSLYKGVTPFPNESYSYVDRDSVVYKVAQKNTDVLGQLPAADKLIHGKYMMMDNEDVENIITRVRQGVYARTPVTTFDDLNVQFNADGHVAQEQMETQYSGSVLFRYTYVVQQPNQ